MDRILKKSANIQPKGEMEVFCTLGFIDSILFDTHILNATGDSQVGLHIRRCV